MNANSTTAVVAGKTPASLQDLVAAKKAELEAQLRALDALDIEALLREREETAVRLVELDRQITQVRAQLGVDASPAHTGINGAARPHDGELRARTNSEEVRRRIFKALSQETAGLSQLQIAERAALAYGTVAAFLKTNADQFRVAGHLKSKRYFLK